MRGVVWSRVGAGLFAMALILAACGGDDGGGDGGPTGATGATTGATGATTGATGATDNGGGITVTTTLTIENFAFDPSTVVVSGFPTEIAVTNNDTTSHTFTLDDESVDLELGAGETGTVTVDVTEDTGFFCRIHPAMTGTLQVS